MQQREISIVIPYQSICRQTEHCRETSNVIKVLYVEGQKHLILSEYHYIYIERETRNTIRVLYVDREKHVILSEYYLQVEREKCNIISVVYVDRQRDTSNIIRLLYLEREKGSVSEKGSNKKIICFHLETVLLVRSCFLSILLKEFAICRRPYPLKMAINLHIVL